jgi:hypothetical protein
MVLEYSYKAVLFDHEGTGQLAYRTLHVSCKDARKRVTRKCALFRIEFTVCVHCSFVIWPVQNEVTAEGSLVRNRVLEFLYRESPAVTSYCRAGRARSDQFVSNPCRKLNSDWKRCSMRRARTIVYTCLVLASVQCANAYLPSIGQDLLPDKTVFLQVPLNLALVVGARAPLAREHCIPTSTLDLNLVL